MNKDQEYYAKKYLKQGKKQKRCIIDGIWFDPYLNRYVKIWRGKRSKLIKRNCNKKFRKMNINIGGKNSKHKRFTEFWNELY